MHTAMQVCDPSQPRADLETASQISSLVLSRDTAVATKAVFYIVYKTIEANPGITINQLKWLLDTHVAIGDVYVNAAVAWLSEAEAINKWTSRKGDRRLRNVITTCRVVHSGVGATKAKAWIDDLLAKYPQLGAYSSPIFRRAS